MAGDRTGQLDLFGSEGEALSSEVSGSSVAVEQSSGNESGGDVLREATAPAAPFVSAVKAPIQDAGVELVANRRNRIRSARTWADLAPLNDALRVKETVKAKVWPKPDYKQLIADGVKPMVAHIIKQVYDSVAAKPVPAAGGVLDDGRLQSYVTTLNRIEQGVMQWARDRDAISAWAKANARVAGAMLGRPIALSELASEPRSLLDAVFPEGWKAYRGGVTAAGGNKLLGALQPGYEEARRAVKALDAGWPEKREAWEVQGFRIEENPEVEIHPWARSGASGLDRLHTFADAKAMLDKVPSIAALGALNDAVEARFMRDQQQLTMTAAEWEEWTLLVKDKAARVEHQKDGTRNVDWTSGTQFFVTVGDQALPPGKFGSRADAEAAVAAIKPFVLFGKRGFLASFESRETAVEEAKRRAGRDKGSAISEKGEKVEEIEREGVSRRLEGEDISSERLMTEFGFKGVNFGNWLKTPATRGEAQLHLNHAFDSLHDLAEILNVPPKAISLNGMLGLAIGAQGSGGAHAAHFVPGVDEVNLTRTHGAGALAHEWGHGLDHCFAKQAGLATAVEPYLTEHAGKDPVRTVRELVDGKWVTREVARFGDIRPEILDAFKRIVEVIDRRDQSSEEAATAADERLGKAKVSRDKWLASISRDFVGAEVEFAALAERVRKSDVGDGHVAVSRSAYLSPVVIEIRDLFKQKHGRLYSLENSKALQSWIDAVRHQEDRRMAEAVHVPAKVLTEFAVNARKLDAIKGGKPYWATKVEMFARAFDAFVSDELEARAIRNEYLAHQGREGLSVPMGAEREMINAAFRHLVGELKTRETERGVGLYSLGAEKGQNGPNRLSRESLETMVRNMRERWPGMPHVRVVDTVAELPFGGSDKADGFYTRGNGQVYLVASNIRSEKEFFKVMAHECILHHSLEAMLGSYGFSKLHVGVQALKKAGDRVIVQLAEEVRARYGEVSEKFTAEDETREIVARAGERCLDAAGNLKIGFGFMKGVFAGVANWLRDHGIPVRFTKLELQGLMHGAGRWIQSEQSLSGIIAGGVARNGVLNSFAGVRAENAPLDKLRIAREMQLCGVDDREIWQQTGWTFGFADGKPRFEITDDAAVVVGHVGVVAGGVRDSRLLIEYPQVGALAADIQSNPEAPCVGSYSAAGVKVNGERGAVASMVVHELQHAVQAVEGFACGGHRDSFKDIDVTNKVLSAINEQVYELYSRNDAFYRDVVKATQLMLAVQDKYGSLATYDVEDPLAQEWWAAIDRREQHPEAEAWWLLKSEELYVARDRVIVTAEEQYRRLAGEVEARLATQRMGMSPEERLGSYPIDGMDVPIADQVVVLRDEARRRAVCEGRFSGKILDVNDGLAVQKTGRDGECVLHVLTRLSTPVVVGDVVDIAYKDGRGTVAGVVCELGVEK